MDFSTLLVNVVFWGLLLTVLWLVVSSNISTAYFSAYLSLIKRNYLPIFIMWYAKKLANRA
ncbi:hypothetical protein BS333_21315 (plasmid) [Vibrio azureus]|nr:hypothetical protein BS333_21315 [Vibrio azureus]